VAVDVARANAAANGVGGRIACVEAAGFEHPDLAKNSPYDLVFANILKGPLVELAPAMAAHTAEGGHVILSGLLTPQAEEVIAAYEGAGLTLAERREIGDWTTLTLRR
jgi:ribosomal protein L11 methyltransferase